MPEGERHIVLVGCGNIGSAILKIWHDRLDNTSFHVLDPSPKEEITGRSNTNWHTTPESLFTACKTPDILILAVKPQIMKNVCAGLASHLTEDTLILSIAAGQKLSNFESFFSNKQPVIRAMTNTPAAIGKGATVAVANTNVSDTQKALATDIMATLGLIEWVKDENLLDAVTALSGSGPAYVFLLIEALAAAGKELGLSNDLSEKLARETVIGAAALAENQPHIPPSTLRQNVTSPGGTTEAALNILMADNSFHFLLEKALKAAKNRSQQLSKQD